MFLTASSPSSREVRQEPEGGIYAEAMEECMLSFTVPVTKGLSHKGRSYEGQQLIPLAHEIPTDMSCKTELGIEII